MRYPYSIQNNDIEQVNIGYIEETFKNLTEYGFESNIEMILEKNGWEKVEENEYGGVFKKDFTIEYTSTVYAVVGYKQEHLGGAWNYGLQWLECEYEYKDNNHSCGDLKDMYNAMRIALEHLLAKGIPFHPSSDVGHQINYWNLTYQEIKRNIDLLNATHLLEFNFKAIKEYSFKDDSIVDWYEKNADRDDKRWMYDFIQEEKKKTIRKDNEEI